MERKPAKLSRFGKTLNEQKFWKLKLLNQIQIQWKSTHWQQTQPNRRKKIGDG